MIELTVEQNEILEGIMQWVENDKRPIAILLGSAGTGKTTLLKSVVEKLAVAKKTYSLLAPTGRAARILGKKTGKPSKTIHSEIYELGDIKADEHSDVIQGELDSPGFAIPFRLKDVADSKATIYIVDESSMVSDKTTQSEILSFGSGRLLHDLLHYARIINCNRVKSKILFVGDDVQLPPVKCSDSPALNKQYFLSEFKIDSALFQLDKVLRQTEGSLILENAEAIRNSIFKNELTSFNINDDGKSVLKIRATQAVKSIVSEQDAGNSVIITVSNREALNYNMAIRRQHFGQSNIEIQKGDVLLVCRNSAKNKYFNGDLLIAVDVDPNTECRPINIRGSENTVDIYYRNILVRSVDEEGNEYNQQCKVIENLLYKPNPTLSLLENRAMIADFRKRHSDIDINSEKFRLELLEDQYFNALLVKFGYAITCHKAQGGEWENVYVSFSGFPNRNSDFYRWAYTAITRSKKTLGVIDPPSFGVTALDPVDGGSYSDDDHSDMGSHADDISLSDDNDENLEIPNPVDPASNNPSGKFNHGKKWSPDEDQQLLSEFKEKKSIKEISNIHGRKRGAIRSRLIKLGVIDKAPSNDVPPEHGTEPIVVDDGVKPLRRGTWKKVELEKVFALWGILDKNPYSIRSISLETGRSCLAIIIQLYKVKLISIEEGDFLCEKCDCPNVLSKAVLLY